MKAYCGYIVWIIAYDILSRQAWALVAVDVASHCFFTRKVAESIAQSAPINWQAGGCRGKNNKPSRT